MKRSLYLILGLFVAFSICLLCLLYVQSKVTDSVRAYVGVEGLYSKAQKDAIIHLNAYARERNEAQYAEFLAHLELNQVAKQVRLELNSRDADLAAIRAWFARFDVSMADANNMIWLFKYFKHMPYMSQSVQLWEVGDTTIERLLAEGQALAEAVRAGRLEEVATHLETAHALNQELEVLEASFSKALSTGARNVYRLLFLINISTALSLALVFFWLARKVVRDLSKHEAELIEHRDRLSELVAERTLALESSNRSLEKARTNAESESRAKSEFLAKMSHEIRTPMNAIVGFSHLALERPLDTEAKAYVEKIHLSSKIIISILNDILDLSKVEADKLTLEAIDFDLGELLQTLVSIVGVNADEKQVELVFNVGKDVNSSYTGDPHRLGQVLTNLLNNAIKFSNPQSQVLLKVERVFSSSEELSADTLQFSVSDSGIGISEEGQRKLFQPFSQAEDSTSRHYGGTGLGLMISKQLVELMGGKIWIESTLGKGATFHFTVQLTRQYRLPRNALASASVDQELNLLIIDGDELSREELSDRIEALGYTVSVAASAEEALQTLRIGALVWPFDALLINQTSSDPHITAYIHREYKASVALPTVLLVNEGQAQDTRYIDERRHVELLPNPPDDAALAQALNRIAARVNHAKAAEVQAADESSSHPARLLLVEDNEINLEIAMSLLTRQGYETDSAGNGEEALERLKSHHYDAILMDCQMPVMDGYEATRQIRRMPGFQEIPILAMTANVTEQDRQEVLACGMNDLIAKPIDVAQMHDTIQYWLRQEKLPGSGDISTARAAQMPDMEGIEVDRGLKNCAGNVGLYKNLLINFREKFRDTGSELKELVAQGRYEDLILIAHSLKVRSNSLGMMPLFEAAAKLEHTAASLDRSLEPALQTVLERMTSLLAELEQL